MATRTGDRLTRLIARRAMGASLAAMGEFEAARVQLEPFLALENTQKDPSLSVHYITDPHTSGLGFLALTLWVLGYPDQAVAVREKVFKRAVEANHANTSGWVSVYAGAQLSALLGNTEDIRAYVENLNAQPEGRMPIWAVNVGQIMKGWAIGCTEHLKDGISLMQRGIEAAEGKNLFYLPHYFSLFAVLQARAGNMQDSLSAISKAKKLIAETGEYFWHADVLRIEGELGLLFGASIKEAEASFAQALEVARKQQARSFELRAGTSLAELWRRQGNITGARNLLAPIYGCFTEGFDTLDLKQANVLLDELAL